MFCPFCGTALERKPFCSECGRSLGFLPHENLDHCDSRRKDEAAVTCSLGEGRSSTLSEFLSFRDQKQKERCKWSKNTKNHAERSVQVNVGKMTTRSGVLKKERGKQLPLHVSPLYSKRQLLQAAERKLRTFFNISDEPYQLLHYNGSIVDKVPGTEKPFMLQDFKDAIGKPFNRLSFFICTEKEYSELDKTEDSDNEVVVQPKHSEEDSLNDTLPWFQSSPNTTAIKASHVNSQNQIDSSEKQTKFDDGAAAAKDASEGASSIERGHWYRNYTEVYAPILIEDEDSTTEQESVEIVE
ncbi:uncharacterized protein LOC114651105 [Erpetoichthys calabaricus]|uniref:uncharacterized protein LOC114651105 n=1 Tax=Erpetoichthys calabaricus TaxID=27687 RepID=UPI00223454EE|nr:uncharacterized protein LOC114651105 [Erpetoichthys calabaricus]